MNNTAEGYRRMSNHYMKAQLEAEKMELYSGIPKEALLSAFGAR